jgi:hypothetical protein
MQGKPLQGIHLQVYALHADTDKGPLMGRQAVRRHLTYSNIMSTIAAFAALTTGGAFAATQITGKQIKDGSIKSADIGNGSVRSADIANGSIQASDIAINGFQIGSGDIINGQVTSEDIENGGVSHEDIHTNSVSWDQLTDPLISKLDNMQAGVDGLGNLPDQFTTFKSDVQDDITAVQNAPWHPVRGGPANADISDGNGRAGGIIDGTVGICDLDDQLRTIIGVNAQAVTDAGCDR